jgi:hypothetical protein
MSIYITRSNRVIDAVRVTAADYDPNAGTFDGSPLSAFPDWLKQALENKVVTIGNPGCTDYASFGVANEYGELLWAGPGDYLVQVKNGKIVTVNGAFFDLVASGISKVGRTVAIPDAADLKALIVTHRLKPLTDADLIDAFTRTVNKEST